jgi:hypothetical protein
MLKTPEAVDKAKHIVGIIDHSYSDKLIGTLLKLEVLSNEQSPNAADYFYSLLELLLDMHIG